jgi:hypothetical protein
MGHRLEPRCGRGSRASAPSGTTVRRTTIGFHIACSPSWDLLAPVEQGGAGSVPSMIGAVAHAPQHEQFSLQQEAGVAVQSRPCANLVGRWPARLGSRRPPGARPRWVAPGSGSGPRRLSAAGNGGRQPGTPGSPPPWSHANGPRGGAERGPFALVSWMPDGACPGSVRPGRGEIQRGPMPRRCCGGGDALHSGCYAAVMLHPFDGVTAVRGGSRCPEPRF